MPSSEPRIDHLPLPESESSSTRARYHFFNSLLERIFNKDPNDAILICIAFCSFLCGLATWRAWARNSHIRPLFIASILMFGASLLSFGALAWRHPPQTKVPPEISDAPPNSSGNEAAPPAGNEHSVYPDPHGTSLDGNDQVASPPPQPQRWKARLGNFPTKDGAQAAIDKFEIDGVDLTLEQQGDASYNVVAEGGGTTSDASAFCRLVIDKGGFCETP